MVEVGAISDSPAYGAQCWNTSKRLSMLLSIIFKSFGFQGESDNVKTVARSADVSECLVLTFQRTAPPVMRDGNSRFMNMITRTVMTLNLIDEGGIRCPGVFAADLKELISIITLPLLETDVCIRTNHQDCHSEQSYTLYETLHMRIVFDPRCPAAVQS